MKLFLIGATGRTGSEIVKQALTRNDERSKSVKVKYK